MTTPNQVSSVRDWLRGLRHNRSLGHTVARGSSAAFSANVGGALAGVLLQFLLTHHMGAHGYGNYVYVLGWMNAIQLLVKFELDTVAIRFVSTYVGAEQWGLLRGLLRQVRSLSFAGSVVVSVMVALALVLARHRMEEELFLSALVVCVMFPAWTMLTVQFGCLQGFKRLWEATMPLLLLRPVLLLVVVGVVTLGLGRNLESTSALLLNFGAVLVALNLSTFYLRRSLRSVPLAARVYETRLWLGTAAGLLPAALAQQVLGLSTDLLVIGTMLTRDLAGVYGIASQIVILMGYGILAVGAASAPLIADLYSRGDLERLRRLVKMVARVNIAVTLPAVIGVALFGRWVLGLFGPAFEAGYPVLLIFGFGQLISTLGGHAALMLTMTGHQKDASVIIGVSAALNFALSLILTHQFSIVGTALATLIGLGLRSILLVIWAQRRTGVSLMPW
jgi:O-antigen/teichoic acid export membrane protein